MKKLFTLMTLLLCAVGVNATWNDIKIDLTSSAFAGGVDQWTSITTGIVVDGGGTVSRVDTSDPSSVGTISGKWHGTTYGWANFTATIPNVPQYVKISYGTNNFGSAVEVTNSSSVIVANLNNNNSQIWSSSNPDRVVTAYYIGEATTLTFSTCNYVGYFAIEAMSAEEIAALETTYKREYDLTSINPVTSYDTFTTNNASVNGGHGWHFGSNSFVKVLVGAYSEISLTQCQYGNVSDCTITFPDGTTKTDFSLKVTTDGTPNTIKYKGGKPGFVTIASTSGDFYIHKLKVTNYAAMPTIASSGISTFSSSNILDLSSLPAGLTAYKVTTVTASAAALEEVTSAVAAGTGLILVGTAGETYSIPGADTGTDISSTNKLKATGSAGAAVAANEAYIMNGGQFKLLTAAGTIPANKAYLLASEVPSARGFDLDLDFGGGVTGISEIEGVKNQKDDIYYDLNGRRVLYPTKGLYIVNGKKVVMK